MIDLEALLRLLPQAFEASQLPLPDRRSGKVRDWYPLPERRRLIVTTDRLSAFDRSLAVVPYKGQVLNQLSAWWFDRTARPGRQPHAGAARPKRHGGGGSRAVPGGSDRARLHHRRHLHRPVVPLLAGRAPDLRLHLPGGAAQEPGPARAHHHPHHQRRSHRSRRAPDLRARWSSRAGWTPSPGIRSRPRPWRSSSCGQAVCRPGRDDPGGHQIRVRPRSRWARPADR